MNIHIPGAAAFALIAAISTGLLAADDTGIPWKTEKVVVFKDGNCLVVKKGKTTTDAEGRAFTDDVPDAAVLGSFWALSDGAHLRWMTAGWVETRTQQLRQSSCVTTLEVLKANTGKPCSLVLDGGVALSGIIQQVLATTVAAPVSQPLRERLELDRQILSPATAVALAPPSPPGGAETSITTIQSLTGDQFVLRTTTGDVLVHASQVRQLTIREMVTTLPHVVTQTTRHKRLEFQFDQPQSDVEVLLMYFRPGIRWIPTYRIDLAGHAANTVASETSQQLAELALQAEIVNEAEDLIDAPIDLVVGVPNFRFRSIPSPLVLEGVLRNALVQAVPQLMGAGGGMSGQLSNALFSQRAGEMSRPEADYQAGTGQAAQLAGELETAGGNDLFVYHLPKMTIRRGQRASAAVLTTQVPYRDVYTWDIQLQRDETVAVSGSAQRSPLVLSENQVWRQIELVNRSDVPWTTGSVMISQGLKPLAQELLTYTPAGNSCRVPVTVAVDLRGRVEDRETGRQLNALSLGGSSYAKVDGTIDAELVNNKAETVDVEIRLRFGGMADLITADGQLRLATFRSEDWIDYRGDPVVNHSSTVTWLTGIKPQQTFAARVDYHFFLRH